MFSDNFLEHVGELCINILRRQCFLITVCCLCSWSTVLGSTPYSQRTARWTWLFNFISCLHQAAWDARPCRPSPVWGVWTTTSVPQEENREAGVVKEVPKQFAGNELAIRRAIWWALHRHWPCAAVNARCSSRLVVGLLFFWYHFSAPVPKEGTSVSSLGCGWHRCGKHRVLVM